MKSFYLITIFIISIIVLTSTNKRIYLKNLCKNFKIESQCISSLALKKDEISKNKFTISFNKLDNLYRKIYEGFDYDPQIEGAEAPIRYCKTVGVNILKEQ